MTCPTPSDRRKWRARFWSKETVTARESNRPEENIAKPREADVLVRGANTAPNVRPVL